MKTLLFTLSLFTLLLLYTSNCSAASVFDEYPGFESESDNRGKGKGKGGGGSIVPEPAVYGAGLIGLSLLVFLYRRRSSLG